MSALGWSAAGEVEDHEIFSLAGKVAVVTGAASGIGAAAGVVLARHGARVVLVDVDAAGAAEVAATVEREGGAATAMPVDVTDREQVDSMVAATVEAHGRLDVMCNVAGIAHSGPFTELADQEIDRVIAVNLKSVVYGCRAAARVMVGQGYGSIVNVASSVIDIPTAGLSLYGLTKAAVANLSLTLADELGPHGVRVNAIAPGATVTSFSERHFVREDGTTDPDRFEDYLQRMRSVSPMGLVGEAADQAYLILYLSSPAARFATGAIFRANGGYPRAW